MLQEILSTSCTCSQTKILCLNFNSPDARVQRLHRQTLFHLIYCQIVLLVSSQQMLKMLQEIFSTSCTCSQMNILCLKITLLFSLSITLTLIALVYQPAQQRELVKQLFNSDFDAFSCAKIWRTAGIILRGSALGGTALRRHGEAFIHRLLRSQGPLLTISSSISRSPPNYFFFDLKVPS